MRREATKAKPTQEARPISAVELRDRLLEICPDFEAECSAEELAESEKVGGPSLAMVMHDFTCYFGCKQAVLSSAQLTKLGALMSDAVSVDDELENVVSTCFLEHIYQIDGYKTLAPFLSDLAKKKTHP